MLQSIHHVSFEKNALSISTDFSIVFRIKCLSNFLKVYYVLTLCIMYTYYVTLCVLTGFIDHEWYRPTYTDKTTRDTKAKAAITFTVDGTCSATEYNSL